MFKTKKTVKFVSSIMAILMVLVMAAGCGNKGTVSDNPPSDPNQGTVNNDAGQASDQPVVLRALWGQSTTDAGLEDLIDSYLAEAYPNITIEWEVGDWGETFQPNMQTYIASGNLPDIMIGKAQDVQTFQEYLADLSGKDYTNRMLDAAVDGVTMSDGNTYGVVVNALYQGVFYNREIFGRLGLKAPDTMEELLNIADTLKAEGITPFTSHMYDTWSIGNVTMQFAINDVFSKIPDWGDKFRASEVSFSDSQEYQTAYGYNKVIFDNTFADTFSTEQTQADARMVLGEAAMKVSGAWSIQNFQDIEEDFDFGIFPFPNATRDAKLIFEPNITLMASKDSQNADAVDKVFDLITGTEDLLVEMYDQTKTASMIEGVTPTFNNPSQTDVDKYVAEGRLIDANLGNNQLVWGGFQEENAKDIAAWLLGDKTFEDALSASDARRANSK